MTDMAQPLLKAIRAKCLDCCCGQAAEVRLCFLPDCSLYPYRFGKLPDDLPAGQKDDAGMTDKAVQTRREYKRAWNRSNPEKVRAAQKRYWNRRASAAQKEEAVQQETESQDAQEV